MQIDVIKRAVELIPDVEKHLSDNAWFILKSIGTYDKQLWEYALALYRGGDSGTFIDQFAAAIDNQLTRAWNEGARDVGVEPGDMTDEDFQAIADIISSEYDHVLGLASAIEEAQGKTLDEFRSQFRARIDLWVTRYTDVVNRAKLYFGGKTRLKWVEGDTIEKCQTCRALDGIVAYAEEWEQAGVSPQGSMLACGGWNCQCKLEPTDQRRSAGALTRIMDALVAGNV